MIVALTSLGAAAVALLSDLIGHSDGVIDGVFKFSGDTCPSSTQSVVEWSTDSWWHPVPVEEIDWSEFRDAVSLTPTDVASSGYLGWQKGWEPFEAFIGQQEPGGGTHAWFRGYLPSGMPIYVWVGSGVEHWWTLNGEPVDVQGEDQLIVALEETLEDRDEVSLDDVLHALKEFH